MRFYTLVLLVFSFVFIHAQESLTIVSTADLSSEKGLPFQRDEFINSGNAAGKVFATTTYAFDVNAFGVGWSTATNGEDAHSFHVEYRFFMSKTKTWTAWGHAHGEVSPDQTPTNMFWAGLIIPDYMESVEAIEVKVSHPTSTIRKVQLDGNYIEVDNDKQNQPVSTGVRSGNCPQPTIIPRSDWWNYTLPSDELYYPNATNSKTVSYNTNTTHAFIHHGASTNNYTDGAAVVRAYWSLHVNSNGWKDIGYNYLIDKYGNLYIGRHNPDFPNRDALGAHTGTSNPYAFAICCVGDYTNVTLPTVALQKLYEMLAYKCELRGLNPTGTGTIAGANIDIISGHRDAAGASTACPGNSMYAILPSIRTNVQSVLNNCANGGVADSIAPTASISPITTWKQTNFTANFTDTDNQGGSGVGTALVNVSYYDSGLWKGNVSNGYFNDDFTVQQPFWASGAGSWSVVNGELVQSNQSIANSNVYASLNQNNHNIFMYHLKAKIDAGGSNKKAGIHFMVSDPSQSDRGNSYLVLFNIDNNKIELHKSVSNTLYFRSDATHTFDLTKTYDFKIVFNKTSGDIDVYVDDLLALTYNDPWAFSDGDYLSLRSENCQFNVLELSVYHERSSSLSVSVGAGKDIPVQNASPSLPAGKIKTITTDLAKNISPIVEQEVNVDWTNATSNYVYDGAVHGNDVNEFYTATEIAGNWDVMDQHSGIQKIYFAVGDTPNGTNIFPLTNIGTVTQFSQSGLSFTLDSTYYITVQVFNGAGMDTTLTSNGQRLLDEPSGIAENNLLQKVTVYPNPSSEEFFIDFLSLNEGMSTFSLIDARGREVYTKEVYLTSGKNKVNMMPNVKKGNYMIKVAFNNEQILLGIHTRL